MKRYKILESSFDIKIESVGHNFSIGPYVIDDNTSNRSHGGRGLKPESVWPITNKFSNNNSLD